MSYKTSIDNKIIIQTFYNNTETTGNQPNNPASIGYVDASVGTINTNITTIENAINLLNSQINILNDSVSQLQNDVNTLSNEIERPIGGIIISPSSTVPPYTLLCDGQQILKTDYIDLFNIIGYSYGGSGNYFNVPNFQNMFPLGANSNIDGIATSNLISGNGTSGATNTQYFSASTWMNSVNPQFPILQVVPSHYHTITDNGHSHVLADSFQVGFGMGTTEFFVQETGTPQNTASSLTGITVDSSGTDIQQVDPISNISGVNITPPYISVFFYITTN